MNKIILLGNMTREPKTTRKKNEDGSEMVITKFDLAVNRRNKQEGNADADFFHCTSFGRQASLSRSIFIAVPGCLWLVVYRIIITRPKRETKYMVSALLLKKSSSHRRKVQETQ